MRCTIPASWSVFRGQGELCQKIGLLRGTWWKIKIKRQTKQKLLRFLRRCNRNTVLHISIATYENTKAVELYGNAYKSSLHNNVQIKKTKKMSISLQLTRWWEWWYFPVPLESPLTNGLREHFCMKYVDYGGEYNW
jgi:hypothetical protein